MAIDAISGIGSLSPSIDKVGKTQTGDNSSVSFGDYLKDALQKVSDLENESNAMTNALAAGQTDNIHGVLIAAEKADIALQFTMQIRNKIMDAYSEIMHMQI